MHYIRKRDGWVLGCVQDGEIIHVFGEGPSGRYPMGLDAMLERLFGIVGRMPHFFSLSN